jgi:hypothetical protein
MVEVDPPVKATGLFAEIVADQEVKAFVEAEPLESLEELLLPPAQALIKIGANIKAIFLIIPLFYFLPHYKQIGILLTLDINQLIKIVKIVFTNTHS